MCMKTFRETLLYHLAHFLTDNYVLYMFHKYTAKLTEVTSEILLDQ